MGLTATLAGAAGTPSGVVLVVTAAGLSLSLTMEHFLYAVLFGGMVLISFVVALYWD